MAWMGDGQVGTVLLVISEMYAAPRKVRFRTVRRVSGCGVGGVFANAAEATVGSA